MTGSEDRDLIERARAGDVEAFERLVRKYSRFGGAIAFGVVRDLDLAEDIVQEAFLRVYESLGTVRDPDRFRGWFASLVRRRAIDASRSRKAHAAIEDLPSEPAHKEEDGVSMAEEPVLRDERRKRVLDAIGALPDADRMVLVLKHMDGLSYKEIAEITGDSIASVESRLFRARRALRERLDGRFPRET